MFHLLSVRHAHVQALRARANAAVFVFTLLALPACVQAQAATRAALTSPWDPTTHVPAPVYGSSLTASKPPSEAPPSWRQANDTVTRIGGWRAYARQAQQSAAPAVSSPSPTQATPTQRAMPTHPGHGAHLSP